ncbi:hypothetical protein GGF46_004366 [Coemansia sp. RSA 552]|nr:hypothetical protein GGF46_004366 [Coemansia sp. RSA 552]
MHLSQSTSSASSDECAVFKVTPDYNVMEKVVRKFYAEDGASFIEHVPGHCLVFIPKTTNVEHVLRELRRIRAPRPRAKPKEKSAKPTNAFIKYRNHKILELKSTRPDISQTEISRMAGECWKSEPEEVKSMFRRKYLEEKRIYDMNKAKRQRTEETATDNDSQSDRASSCASPALSSIANVAGVPDYGLNMGLDNCAIDFSRGRRRSQTLPSGSFGRSGAKRRISQELRKHLASKSSNAYFTAPPGVDLLGDGSGMSPFPMQQQQPQPQQQQQTAPFSFTFPPPQVDHAGTSSSYMDMAPLAMPLNPNFPIADFTSAAPPMPSHHTRTLTSMSTPLSIDTASYASGSESLDTFVGSTSGLTTSTAEVQVSGSLPLLDTTGLQAFANDSMPMSSFNAGYLTADVQSIAVSTATSWPLQPQFAALHDAVLQDAAGSLTSTTQSQQGL